MLGLGIGDPDIQFRPFPIERSVTVTCPDAKASLRSKRVTTKTLNEQNGVRLFEAELRGVAGALLGHEYTVMTKLSPEALYQGSNRAAAEKAFHDGVAAARI